MANEEYIMKLSMLEQESGKIQEQLGIIHQQLADFENLRESIGKLEKSEADILTPVGKGIFVKSKISERKFFVNVGAGVILKRDADKTAEIIKKQVGQLENFREILGRNMEEINNQVQELIFMARESVETQEAENS